jgi:PKD repeat protein
MKLHWRSLLVVVALGSLVAGACAPPPAPGNTPPTAVIQASPDSGPAPLEVTFSGTGSSDPDGVVVAYAWDLGDGNTATGPTVVHTYATPGVYTVSLTVTDDDGATGTTTTTVTAGVPNQPPVAVASATPTSGKEPLVVAFDGDDSSDADGTVVSYAWDFGDGNTANVANPTHTYATAGTYTAQLVVTDDEGATGTDTVTIVVNANQAPTAVASASPTVGKEPLEVTFSSAGSADPDGTIVSYAWDFDDGNTANVANPTHTYAVAGTYTATLTVTDDNGATDTDTVTVVVNANQPPVAAANATPTAGQVPLTVSFSSAASTDPDGTIVSYAWAFGDGNTSSLPNPVYTYSAVGTYTATLTVTDDNGATDIDTVTIEVNPVPNVPPTAAASATPPSGKVPLTVSFSSAGSTDPDGSIVSYAWDFGDGGTSSLANPSHTYTLAGTYTAQLVVTDNSGATATATVTITVDPNQAPTAAASATPLTGKAPLVVTFSSAGSTDSDGSIVSYAWDFGDGGTSSLANPSHTYTLPGTYTAQLVVTDDNGATDTATVTITAVPNQPPVAGVNAAPQSGARPLVVAFSSASSVDPDGTIVSYAWNFGDGNTSTAANPTHTYTTAGTFTATLTVTDDNGATDTDSVLITVVIDDDGDGFSPPADCDDSSPTTYPGAPDALDDLGVDSNCDGYDGVATATYFVKAAGGLDTPTCGPVDEPCASIGQGQARAIADGRTTVLVAGGTYGPFTLAAGLTVAGNYGQNFQRGAGATGSTSTTVNGAFDSGLDAAVAVQANGISTPTQLRDMSIVGANAPAGKATYGLVLRNSTAALTLRNLSVTGGTGGAGAAGTAGTSATQTPAASGNPGENSQEVGSVCSTARKAGGAAVSGSGAGGQGGSQDTSCTLGVCAGSACNATAGLAGGNGTGFQAGVCGFGGGGGAGVGSGNAGNGANGANGCVTDGTGGSPGVASNGTVGGNGLWAPSGGTGGTGTLGQNGTPGGGGGGGGGSDETNDDMGAGGGSGGAAGTRATQAGSGGGPGGASIGIYLDNAVPTMVNVAITLGTGGTGGAGGAGGLGQPGGAGGAGGKGLCNNNTGYTGYPFGNCPTGGNGGAGGNGGNGGRGGHAGGGGGGAGGPSFGLVKRNSSPNESGVSFSGGSGGAGGAGGTTGVAGSPGQTGPKVNSVTL